MKAPKITLSRGDAILIAEALLLLAESLHADDNAGLPPRVDRARRFVYDQALYLQSRLYAMGQNYPEYEQEFGEEEVDRSDIPF